MVIVLVIEQVDTILDTRFSTGCNARSDVLPRFIMMHHGHTHFIEIQLNGMECVKRYKR